VTDTGGIFGWLAPLGAAATVGMGLLGLLAPARCAAFVGLTARDRSAFAEFRATYGGLFIALGAVPLWSGHPLAYFVAAAAWAGAAGGRVVSVLADHGHREPRNFAALAFESAFAALLATGA
jgi:hypothetical protein